MLPLYNERFVGCGRDKVSQNVAVAWLYNSRKLTVSRYNFLVHTQIKGAAGIGLCPFYPPPFYNYISFATSWLMTNHQSQRGIFDMENIKKQTVLWNKTLPLESIDRYEKNFDSNKMKDISIRIDWRFILLSVATVVFICYFFRKKIKDSFVGQ